MINKPFLAVLALISFVFFNPALVSAQIEENFKLGEAVSFTAPSNEDLSDQYYKAEITRILEEGRQEVTGSTQEYQKLEVKILNGDKKGELIIVNHGLELVIGTFKKMSVGDKVVLAKPSDPSDTSRDFYYIIDQYRLPAITGILLIFFALAIFFGRKRGLTSILGMMFTVLVIFNFIIPRILKGGDPLINTVAGGMLILLISLYLSHGFNRRTSIALVSTLISLGLAVVFDYFFVKAASLSGIGSEEAFFLQFDTFKINLQGLLMAGIIIGVLGVLDDITTAQSAAVEEIHKADSTLPFSELYKRGISVGREHIASLINTLVLAYAGASFPVLLLYSNRRLEPTWVTLNSNFIAEEIIRTLVGSTVLVISVPLTTFLAAWYYSRRKKSAPLKMEFSAVERQTTEIK